jgi:hypothetical protein
MNTPHFPPRRTADPPASVALSQGDWLFVPEPIDTLGLAVHWCAPLIHPGGGTPHVVAELVRAAEAKVYARGTVRHPDYATIHLDSWHRVHLRH